MGQAHKGGKQVGYLVPGKVVQPGRSQDVHRISNNSVRRGYCEQPLFNLLEKQGGSLLLDEVVACQKPDDYVGINKGEGHPLFRAIYLLRAVLVRDLKHFFAAHMPAKRTRGSSERCDTAVARSLDSYISFILDNEGEFIPFFDP